MKHRQLDRMWNRHQTIWVYMWKNWKEQCRMTAYITINPTMCYCSKLSIRLVITTTKNFSHSFCHLSELLSLVTCKQRADHFTPMMWFDFIRWRFHFIKRLFRYSNYIKYNQIDVIQNWISPETHNWYIYIIWDRETPYLWFSQMPSQGEMGGRKIFACLSTCRLFVEQPVVG